MAMVNPVYVSIDPFDRESVRLASERISDYANSLRLNADGLTWMVVGDLLQEAIEKVHVGMGRAYNAGTDDEHDAGRLKESGHIEPEIPCGAFEYEAVFDAKTNKGEPYASIEDERRDECHFTEPWEQTLDRVDEFEAEFSMRLVGHV